MKTTQQILLISTIFIIAFKLGAWLAHREPKIIHQDKEKIVYSKDCIDDIWVTDEDNVTIMLKPGYYTDVKHTMDGWNVTKIVGVTQ